MSNNSNNGHLTMATLREADPYTCDLTRYVVEQVQAYLHMPDPAPFLLVLATIVANRLPGKPVWLMLIAPPGSAKSDLLSMMYGIPTVREMGSFSEAALLSGTPSKERNKESTGGLLYNFHTGVLIAKDFGTVFSMNREQRAAVMAALREVYDGDWVRHVGSDGGKKIPWHGRIGFLGAVTPTTLEHHGTSMATFGDRFIYHRVPKLEGLKVARTVIDRAYTGKSEVQLDDLKEMVAGLVEYFVLSNGPLLEDERDWLANAANIAAWGRSPVERDGYHRDVIGTIERESPGRLADVMGQLMLGLSAIGCTPHETRRLIIQIASDCIPSSRLRIIQLLTTNHNVWMTVDMMMHGDDVDYPENAVRRLLEEMEYLRIVESKKVDGRFKNKDEWHLLPTFKREWDKLNKNDEYADSHV